mmetsp:Transcript_50249/g.117324  ORF Transcript_50249/g.117324 Transcript_50249/m.117324 type:complete len:210 (+) Transcript_50249:2760-3389(+)
MILLMKSKIAIIAFDMPYAIKIHKALPPTKKPSVSHVAALSGRATRDSPGILHTKKLVALPETVSDFNHACTGAHIASQAFCNRVEDCGHWRLPNTYTIAVITKPIQGITILLLITTYSYPTSGSVPLGFKLTSSSNSSSKILSSFMKVQQHLDLPLLSGQQKPANPASAHLSCFSHKGSAMSVVASDFSKAHVSASRRLLSSQVLSRD